MSSPDNRPAVRGRSSARDGVHRAAVDPGAPAVQSAKPRKAGEGDAQTEFLESVPETKRWDPVPGSPGHQAPEPGAEDEDAEGRSETEQLVDDGVAEAERDQILQAARAAARRDRGEP